LEANTEGPRINILINLSSLLLCEALQAILQHEQSNYRTVIAQHSDPHEQFQPDEILLDAATLERSLPGQWPDVKLVLVDTGLAEEEITRLLVTYRLHGVISTGTGVDLFHKALQTILADHVWIDNDKLKALLQTPPLTESVALRERFSNRERDVVFLIADGCRNREIATRLKVSEQTVKSHISRIFRKANVTSRTQLAPLALKLRL
jgi:LuxR family transcriptional regulator, positive regulator of biofilm formation